jgi:hypothetical protein
MLKLGRPVLRTLPRVLQRNKPSCFHRQLSNVVQPLGVTTPVFSGPRGHETLKVTAIDRKGISTLDRVFVLFFLFF